MGRPLRLDRPGALHHVMNRALSRRPLFSGGPDIRHFLSLLARCVRAGQIRIHAFAVLTTHFHLVVESLTGDLSKVMHRVQCRYSRRYNWRNGRDGGLVRSRYVARAIGDDAHLAAVIGYVERNPLDAGLVQPLEVYPYASARHFASPRSPPWLTRERVLELTQRIQGRSRFDPATYLATWTAYCTPSLRHLVGRASMGLDHRYASIDALVRGAPRYVTQWLQANAQRADGLAAESGCLAPETLDVVLDDVSPSAWDQAERNAVHAGLLRIACGLTWREIGSRLRIAPSTAQARAQSFQADVAAGGRSMRIAQRLLMRALACDYGPARSVSTRHA